MEFALDERGGFLEAVEVRWLAGNFQVTAAREIALDLLLVNDLFHKVNGLDRRGIHLAHDRTTVALDELGHWQFHSGQDHTSVTAARAPTKGFRLEYGSAHTTLGQRARRGKPAETAAHNRDVGILRQFPRHAHRRWVYRFEPIIFCLNRHGCAQT